MFKVLLLLSLSLGACSSSPTHSEQTSSSSLTQSSSSSSLGSADSILIDDFSDGDLISKFGVWQSFSYGASAAGYADILGVLRSEDSAFLRSSFVAGQGEWTDEYLQLNLPSSLNLSNARSLWIRARSTVGALRFSLLSPLVMDYAYHGSDFRLDSNWAWVKIDLGTLKQPSWSKDPISLDSALRHPSAFKFHLNLSNGQKAQLDLDQIWLVLDRGQKLLLKQIDSLEYQGLRHWADQRDLALGSAVYGGYLGIPLFRWTVSHNFNYLTPENEMTFKALQPAQGRYQFAPADLVVSFAAANGLKIHSQHLIWHQEVPDWINNLTTPDQMDNAMEMHIQTVINHYNTLFPGTISHWSVVNEVFDNSSTADPWKNSIWMRIMGSSFIDSAFIYAKRAAPNAKLYYNDYFTEGMNAKSDRVYNLVKGLRQRGIPIDGVGLQCHFNLENYPGKEAIAQNMQRIADLGLEIYLTEIDVEITDTSTASLNQQAQIYTELLSLCLSQKACKSYGVWGVTDQQTWLRSFRANPQIYPLLFDDCYEPKASFDSIFHKLSGKGV